MFKLGVLLFGLVAAAYGNLNVQRCSATGALPTRVTIAGCTRPPCQLVAGTTVAVQVTFTAPGAITRMSAQLTGYRNNRPISYDIGAAGLPCNHLIGNQCPIRGGQSVVYAPRLFVNNNVIQGVTMPVELRVRDHGAWPVMCFRVDVRVVARTLQLPGFAPKQQENDGDGEVIDNALAELKNESAVDEDIINFLKKLLK